MAYSTGNQPFLITPPPVAGGFVNGSSDGAFRAFGYKSTHTHAAVRSGHITNANKLGMRKYDLVFTINTGSTSLAVNMVSAISTAGAATLVNVGS